MKSIFLTLLLAAGCCYGQAQETPGSIKITDEQVRAIDSLINATYKADEPGAAVLLAQDGKILLHKGYGMANMELQVPVNPGHVFGIGTLSKYFTAIAILILQEQGKLSVNDDIRKYIPGYNTHGKTITIENLLTHTCGIPGFREYVDYGVKDKLEESRYAGLQFSEEKPLLFEPGTNWSYSLPGYGLLSLIVENRSGQLFIDFIQQQIFDKLGMTQTYFGKKAVTPQKTTGYIFNPARKAYERFEEGIYVQSSAIGVGSILSTVDDLYRWHMGLKDGKIISPASLKKAWTSYILPNGIDVHFGYGRTINRVNGQLFVEHGGVMPNYLSDEWQMPEQNIYFVVLSNQRKNARTPPLIANKVAALIIGFNPTKVIKTPDPGELIKLAGVYETVAVGTRLQKNYTNVETVHWKVVDEDGKLFVKRQGILKTELIPFDDSTWYMAPDPFNRFIFRKDMSGNTTGLTTTGIFTQSGPARFCKKIASIVPPPPPIRLIDSVRLRVYTGIFQQPGGTRQKLMIENNKLVLTDEDNLDKKELSYTGNHSFIDPKTEVVYKFIAAKSGRIIKVNYFDGTLDIVSKRIRDNY
jgi:CubicO group peptidase (beta-lactamase class C family)